MPILKKVWLLWITEPIIHFSIFSQYLQSPKYTTPFKNVNQPIVLQLRMLYLKRLKFTPCLFLVCWNLFELMFLYHYRLWHHLLKRDGGSQAIKRKKYCFESSPIAGVGCHNQSCVSLICLVYLDMMQHLVQNEKPSNRPSVCEGVGFGGSREEKMAKLYLFNCWQ